MPGGAVTLAPHALPSAVACDSVHGRAQPSGRNINKSPKTDNEPP